MLPDPTGLEKGKLLGLQLLGLQDTLLPSQPQQLSTASFHGGADTLYSYILSSFGHKHNFNFFLCNQELAADKAEKSSRLLEQISEVRRSCLALLRAAAPSPASSQNPQELSWVSLDLLSSLSQHLEPGRCLSISLGKKMTEPGAQASDEKCFSFL